MKAASAYQALNWPVTTPLIHVGRTVGTASLVPQYIRKRRNFVNATGCSQITQASDTGRSTTAGELLRKPLPELQNGLELLLKALRVRHGLIYRLRMSLFVMPQYLIENQATRPANHGAHDHRVLLVGHASDCGSDARAGSNRCRSSIDRVLRLAIGVNGVHIRSEALA
jgi:hypothetical protein